VSLATGYGPISDRPQPSDENRGAFWIDPSTQTLTVQIDDTWHEVATTPEPAFSVVYNSGTDELVVTSLAGFDFTPVVTINFTGNGTGQITRPPFFTLDSPSQITVQQASIVLNGGVLTALDFFVGLSIAASWTGSVPLI
jgi:hypothetical protein